jgi:hypothetical protein
MQALGSGVTDVTKFTGFTTSPDCTGCKFDAPRVVVKKKRGEVTGSYCVGQILAYSLR